MASTAYTKGLHEVGDGLFAYLQPDGGWGWEARRFCARRPPLRSSRSVAGPTD